MQVTNATNPATRITTPSDSSTTDPGASSAGLPVDNLANTQTFLQLLVAQIKNQDPLQPSDSIQFVTQLAQFSSLEQLIGIRGEIGTLTTPAASDPASNSSVPNV